MSYKHRYLKYKKKYLFLKDKLEKRESINVMTGGYIPDTLIGYEMVLTAQQVLKYNINCGPNLSYNIPNGIYNSSDPQYSNYSFKLRSCKEDFNGYYYLTIYKKPGFSLPISPIINNKLIMLYIKYTTNVFIVYVNKNDYVYNLKNIIYKKIGIIPVQQQLIFKNIILDDMRLLSQYNIIEYDTIILNQSQTISTYPNIPINIIPNQPLSIFTKLSTKKSYDSSSSSSSSSDSDYKSRKTRNLIKTKEPNPNNNENKVTNITNSDTDERQKINLNINKNYINWFIFNERKDKFNYWEKSKDSNKIENSYQEYLETAKLLNSSVLTTIEPKIFIDYKTMKFITINIDNTTTNRKIKRIFLEKIKISEVKWMLEEEKNEWKKMLDPAKIEELYQVFTIYKSYFIKNPIFYLEDDTFIDFKNMLLIVKDTKRKIKRE